MRRSLLVLLLATLLLCGAGCGPLQPANTPPTYGSSRGSGGA